MATGKSKDAGGCRCEALRGWASALAWVLLFVLLGILVLRNVALTGRTEDLEARAGALEALARRQRGQIAELQAGTPAGGQPAETVALVIEMAGEDFPQVIVRAGLDTERERRIVLLLPSQDRQRLEQMRTEWATLTDREKARYVGALTAAVEAGVRRELPSLFAARADIEEALFTALDAASGALESPAGGAARP